MSVKDRQQGLQLVRSATIRGTVGPLRVLAAIASLAFAATLLLLPWPGFGGQAAPLVVRPVASFALSTASLPVGEIGNLLVDGAGLTLRGDQGYVRSGRAFGQLVSEPQLVEGLFDQVRASIVLDPASTGEVLVDARSSADGVRWSSWSVFSLDGGPVSLPPGRFFQYRVELSGLPGERPLLRDVSFDLATTGAQPDAASGQNPTVRVLGSREGLVGLRTANGHTIVERDRFAALPSRRVLNANGKTDYQIKITYKDRSTIVPIWDVGPWNIKDNYWDEKREMWTDLPRFMPQAFAAWMNDYNGGRDQFNRWVSFPASVDIADGAFIEDLGMKRSDWVDVTFLWIDAPSPPSQDLPAFTALKPEPNSPTTGPGQTLQSLYFAEGNTQRPFQTSFTLLNPSDADAKANFTFMKKDGSIIKQEIALKPGARQVVNANQLVPSAEFSTRIEATRPILAERTTYFEKDGHSTTGAPAPKVLWYLADGSSQAPYDTWILIQNPGLTPANVVLTFYRDNDDDKMVNIAVPPTSRRSVYVNDYVPQSTFATRIGADQPIVVERSVYLAKGGGSGTLAASSPSKTWYFADGSTEGGFDSWISLYNPTRRQATATLTYLREGDGPVTQQVTLDVGGRASIHADPDLAGPRFGLKIEADQTIVAERAMYFGGGSDGKGTGAHASVGAIDTAKVWYLPDGSTQAPYQEKILVANPGADPSHLRIDYIKGDGSTVTREYDVDGQSRLTIAVNEEIPNAQLSARVTADQPVVVERSTYFSLGAGSNGGTNSFGIPR